LFFLAKTVGSGIDEWVVFQRLEGVDARELVFEVFEAGELVGESGGVFGPFSEGFDVSVFEAILPRGLIEEALVLEDFNRLIVILLLLKHPPNLFDLENIRIEQILLSHEIQNILLTSIVQNILQRTKYFVSPLKLLHNLQTGSNNRVSNKSIVLGDGGWVATEVSSGWEIELESQLMSLQSIDNIIVDFQIVELIHGHRPLRNLVDDF
jgi:hypothetical protein